VDGGLAAVEGELVMVTDREFCGGRENALPPKEWFKTDVNFSGLLLVEEISTSAFWDESVSLRERLAPADNFSSSVAAVETEDSVTVDFSTGVSVVFTGSFKCIESSE